MINSKVYIYGLCNVFYDSFYIEGIREIFPDVEFNISKFPDFSQDIFAFILVTGNNEKKIIIDSRDSNEIDSQSFNWCDRYGKVNYNLSSIESLTDKNKIIAIGPSFGIKIWGIFKTIFLALYHSIIFNSRIKNKREFLANYWRQYKRSSLNSYKPMGSKDNEVFFISTIWQKENATNKFRETFINECRNNNDLKFEGGFAPRKNGDNLGYDKFVYEKRITLSKYLSKIKNSSFVFNTPAVLSCHGWKLAEFLALGKAIISTPHLNIMPETMQENVDIVYVENSIDIENKINLLLHDLKFKINLEKNSYNYFERNLTPKIVINKLIQ